MEKFIVYGAGKIGKTIYRFLEQTDTLDLVFAFCDRKYKEISVSDDFGKIPVIDYPTAKNSGLPFVIGVGGLAQPEIKMMFEADGVRFYSDIQEWIKENYVDREQQLLQLLEYQNIHLCANGKAPIRRKRGICPFCKNETVFVAYDWERIREDYRCIHCQTSPRQRAFFVTLNELVPDWRNMSIHESSPSGPISGFIKDYCAQYSSSFFYEDKPLGASIGENITNQNLEALTFPDNSFDIIITQDVFEHINEPAKAFKEICRVLKKGGKHIFTVPMWRGKKTFPRIRIENGKRILTAEAIYHGNPISEEGALLTYEWGDDMIEFIDRNVYGGETTKTRVIHFPRSEVDLDAGLDAGDEPGRDNNVIVTVKL